VPVPVAIIVKGYPRLSETFIAQEILALEQRGLEAHIVSLRRPTDPAIHDLHRRIRAPVLYLPEYLYEEPLRVLRGLLRGLRRPGFRRALLHWLRDLRRDPTANRGRRFGQALVLAAELPPQIGHLHLHYLHTPASVGFYAAEITGLPFSLSAHAKDIWTTPDWEKREKLAACRWAVTCSRDAFERLAPLAPEGRLALVYHGLDLSRFPAPAPRAGSNGTDPAAPVHIVSVARAVPKKGLDLLLDALARLPPGLHWRFSHRGGGAELDRLKERARRLGIEDRLRWLGPGTQAQVLELLREGDIFCLPARIAADGDRDGLPNVILEALSQELAVVATPVGAIGEAVFHERTGLLVPSEDADALAEALAALCRDPLRRRELGRAGRAVVAERFRFATGIAELARRFDLREPGRDAA